MLGLTCASAASAVEPYLVPPRATPPAERLSAPPTRHRGPRPPKDHEILAGSPMAMYAVSGRGTSAKRATRFRWLTCHGPVIPGCTSSREQWCSSLGGNLGRDRRPQPYDRHVPDRRVPQGLHTSANRLRRSKAADARQARIARYLNTPQSPHTRASRGVTRRSSASTTTLWDVRIPKVRPPGPTRVWRNSTLLPARSLGARDCGEHRREERHRDG